MIKHSILIFFANLCLSFISPHVYALVDDNIYELSFPASLSIKQTLGKGIGNTPSYTTLEFLIPLKPLQAPIFSLSYPSTSILIPIIDIRAHYLNYGRYAGSIGMGARQFYPAIGSILGLHLFYDFRQTPSYTQQAGISFELMGRFYNFRINGYLPCGNRVQSYRPVTFNYPGGYVATCQERRNSLTGTNGEIEFPFRGVVNRQPINLYTTFGIYHYKNSGCGCHKKKADGGYIRLELDYLNFNLETNLSYDPLFSYKFQSTIGFSFPFNIYPFSSNSTRLIQMRTQRIKRENIIIKSKKYCDWEYNW